jgi:uncharacterized protein YpmB
MGKFIFGVVILVLAGVAYLMWSKMEEAPKEATYDAYTKRVIAQEQKAKDVASSTNVENVHDAVEKYKSMKGGNPATLQDLVPEYLDHIPGGVGYDPASGAVSAIQ